MQSDAPKIRVRHALIHREEVQIPSLIRHEFDPPGDVWTALHANEKNSAAHFRIYIDVVLDCPYGNAYAMMCRVIHRERRYYHTRAMRHGAGVARIRSVR